MKSARNSNPTDAPKKVIDFLIRAGKKHPSIQKIVLFGSRARNDGTLRSDYDLAIFSTKGRFKEWSNFALEVREMAPTLAGFDLVLVTDDLNSELRKSIDEEGVILYESSEEKKH